MRKRYLALVLAGLMLLACAACGEGKTAMRPAIMYQGDLYLEVGISDIDLEGENTSYAGEITSLVPSYELPQEDWQGNNETQLNAKVYLSDDGTLHLLLSNGRLIETKRHSANAPITTDTPDVSVPNGPFASARRILTHDDLAHGNKGAPIIEPGEVLVFFTYMEPFDIEAWRESTVIWVPWAAEAVNHAASLEYMGEGLRNAGESDGAAIFSHQVDYGFGIAVNETWLLPEDEYAAAFEALMAAARGAGDKAFWLVPNQDRGNFSQSYSKDISFNIHSYLPEELWPRAEAIHMSTELMREHFPFLGSE